MGRFAEALACYRESAEVAEEYGFTWGIAVNYFSMGDTRRLLGGPDRALELYLRAVDYCRESGDREGEAILLERCAQVASDLGRTDDAGDYGSRARVILDELGDARAAAVRARLAPH